MEAKVELVAKGMSKACNDTGHATLSVATVLICDTPLLRSALKHLLTGTRFIVAESASHDLVASITESPALFIIGAKRCSDETSEVVRQLRAQHSDSKICVLTDEFDIGALISILDAGAHGFCLTTGGHDVLICSLELIMLGETIIPSDKVLSAINQMSRIAKSQPELSTVADETEGAGLPAHKLSTREGEVLRCLMEGSPNKVIARQFGLTEATVKVHVKAILRKIGAKNRTQAAMWATDRISTASSEKPNLWR